MPFTFEPTDLPGILVIVPKVFADDRGFLTGERLRPDVDHPDGAVRADMREVGHQGPAGVVALSKEVTFTGASYCVTRTARACGVRRGAPPASPGPPAGRSHRAAP